MDRYSMTDEDNKAKGMKIHKMGFDLAYDSESTNFKEKDYSMRDKAYEKQNQKLNLGEEFMLTGNPYFDIGLALGRKRAKVNAGKKNKK